VGGKDVSIMKNKQKWAVGIKRLTTPDLNEGQALFYFIKFKKNEPESFLYIHILYLKFI
jgi:hypothetical protein